MLLQEKPSLADGAGLTGRIRRIKSSPAFPVALSLFVLLAVCVHWFHPGFVIAQDDNPPITTPGIWFAKAVGAWSNYNSFFGQLDGSFTFLPFMLLWWPSDALFGPGLGQILTHFVLAAAAWTGAYRMIRMFGISSVAALIGAWAYTLNPFTQMVFGNNLTGGIFFALLAWIGFWTIAAALAPARRRQARLWLAVLAFAAVPAVGVTPSLVFQTALGAIALLGFGLIATADKRSLLVWFAGTAALMIAAALWWAVPDVLSFAGATIPHPTSLTDLSWTYERSSLLNNLRFLYTWLWKYPEYYPVAPAYDANPITYAAGFFGIASAAAGLIVLRGRRLALCRYALAAALVVMFVSKGPHPPLAWVNGALSAIPGAFFLYADPAGEVTLALLLLGAAAAFTFDSILMSHPPQALTQRRRTGAAVAALAVIAASALPLLTGAIFHGPVVASNGTLTPSMYVKTPAYWHAAAAYLNASAQPGGVLVLPPHLSPGYDVEYDFGYYGVDAVATNLISRRLLYLDAGLKAGLGYLKHAQAQAVADRVRDLLAAGSPLALPMMRDVGVRYVLFRGDIVHVGHAWYSQGELSRLLGREPRRFGPLAIYDIGAARPSFALTSHWIAGEYGSASSGDLEELAALEEPYPRVSDGEVPARFSGWPSLVEQSAGAPSIASGSGSGIDRVVTFASQTGLSHDEVLERPAARRELRASTAGISQIVEAADAPLADLSAPPSAAPVMLVSHPVSFARHGGVALAQSVTNLNPYAVRTDVAVPVPDRPLQTYALAAQGVRYTGQLVRTDIGTVARFSGVVFAAGTSIVRLTSSASSPRVTPIAGASAAAGRLHYAFFFERTARSGAPSAPPLKTVASARADFSGADRATIEILPAPPNWPQLTALVRFTDGAGAFRCPVALPPDQAVGLNFAVSDCLRQSAGEMRLSALRIDGIDLLASPAQPDSAIDGARLYETALDASYEKRTAPAARVSTTAVAHVDAEGSTSVVTLQAPGAASEPAAGALVTTQDGSQQISGVVSGDGKRALAVELPNHAIAWIPHSSPNALTVTGYRLPVTLHWNIAPADAVNAEIHGCEASVPARITLGAGAARSYTQELYPALSGSGVAAGLTASQIFAARGARVRSVTVSCIAEIPVSGAAQIQASLVPLVRRVPGTPLRVEVLPGTRFPAPVALSALPQHLSVAALGAAPAPPAPAVISCASAGSHCGMAGVAAPIPAGFAGLAVYSRLYSPTWVAIQLDKGISFPRHVSADGWRNAWFVSGGGELLLVNLMDLFSVLFALLGAGLIVWQARYKRV